MSNVTCIGIDLAWKSARNPTGAAVLKGDRSGARLEAVTTLQPEAPVSELIKRNSTANTVIAIDAPLIIINETGQRSCETAVGKRYGSRDASCHTSNLRLYRDASSVALAAKLLADGFVHAAILKDQWHGKVIAEVYPHAAMVALWNLPNTIKYKKGSAAERRAGLQTLRTHLAGLRRAEPHLRSGVMRELLAKDLDELTGQNLKNYEDLLDAVFCAYLAFYFWYWGWERNEIFGDLKSGYILNPKLNAVDKSHPAQPGMDVEERFIRLVTPAVAGVENSSVPPAEDRRLNDADVILQTSFWDIITEAHQLARPIAPSPDCHAGSVASVIISTSGQHYTGICLDFCSGIGFCAEHAAVAEMLKSHESKISLVVAVDETGKVLSPCGRCREMMWQLDPRNKDALVVLSHNQAVPLRDLLPHR